MSKEKQQAGENVEIQSNLLDNFAWETEDSFFGINDAPVEQQQQQLIEEVKKPKEEKKNPEEIKPLEDEEKEDEETEFFETLDKAEKPAEAKTEDEPDEDEEFYSTLSAELKEKGIFQFATLPDDGKVSQEKFFEIHEEEVEARTDQAIKDFIAEMNDEDGGAFINFKRAGGKTSDFFNFYSQTSTVPEVDTDTETGQDAILKHYYKTVEQLDDDDIDDKLEWLKESGKKKKYAEKYNSKLIADKKEATDQFLKNQVDTQKQREDDKKQFITSLKTTASTVENVSGFVFNKRDADEYVDYITKPSVKLKGNQYLTAFQAELTRVMREEPDKLLILAKLLKNKFDTSDMVIAKETEAAKKIKSNLENKKSRLSSTSSVKKRSLTDYF